MGNRKVLNVVATLDVGGVENMMVNLVREGLRTDFATCTGTEGYYEEEVKKLGSRVYRLTKRSKSIVRHHVDLYKILKKGRYEVVHLHTQNAFFTSLHALVARLAGVGRVISHSHNTKDWRKNSSFLHKLSICALNTLVDVKLACGEGAAEWLYGKKDGVSIIPLPIDCSKFMYDEKIRRYERERLGLKGKKVFICVGRFSDVKNQMFLVDVFNDVVKYDNNCVLLFVGDGENRVEVGEKVTEYGLSENIKFLGIIGDVYSKMIASDVFLLPSLYEGFPTVVLEAVSTGLPCLVSDKISSEVRIGDYVKRVCLEKEEWVKRVLSVSKLCAEKRLSGNELVALEYDVRNVKSIVEKIYKG